ncbi:MAG: methyltransferase domain-containing protein [Eubacteriales bacterium]
MVWNAELYDMFGKERLQPTLDLLNRIPDGNYLRIIDIGCGTGMSTLPLVQRFNCAKVIGVDYSKEMLQKAKLISQKVKWVQRDCSKSLDDMGDFDLVFSNAFLQWLQNQEEFIYNIYKILNQDGIFALQVPNYDNMPIKKCADRLVRSYGNRLEEVEKKMCHNKSLNEYYDILCDHFSDVEIWQTNYSHVMNNYEEIVDFISSTGIRPYLEIMDIGEQNQFKNYLKEEIKKEYTVQKNGKIIFTFERIEFIARK